MENTEITDEFAVKVVGLDGRSNPMYRYAADMNLPDHMRRIVKLEHRPDTMHNDHSVWRLLSKRGYGWCRDCQVEFHLPR